MHHVDPSRIESDRLPCFSGADVRIARAGYEWSATVSSPNGVGRSFRVTLSGGAVHLVVDANDKPVELDQALRSVRHLDAGLPSERFLVRGAELEFAMAGELLGFRGRAGAMRFGALFKPSHGRISLTPWYGSRQLRS